MKSHSTLRFTLSSVRASAAVCLAIVLSVVTPSSAGQYSLLEVPYNSSDGPPGSPPFPTNPGYPDNQYNLPGYGLVEITLSNTSGNPYYGYVTAPSLGDVLFTPGSTLQNLGFYNPNYPPNQNTFTVNFTFLNGAPDPARLALFVTGISYGTFIQPSIGVTELGEQLGPTSSTISSTTQTGLASFYDHDTYVSRGLVTMPVTSQENNDQYLYSTLNGDPRNTGDSLWQAPVTSTNFQLGITSEAGDGWGISLAYAVPEPSTLVLASAALMVGLVVAAARRRVAHVTEFPPSDNPLPVN